MQNESMTNQQYATQRSSAGCAASTRLLFFLLGGGVGAIVALLFAPQTGRELRMDIADVLCGGADRRRDAAEQIESKAGEYYDAGRDCAFELYEAAANKAGVLADAATRKSVVIDAAAQTGKEVHG